MPTVNAYGAPSATEPLRPMLIERRELGPHDVNIEIHYTGICHSDIHHTRSDWGDEPYPLVPGHEIAGIVTEVGAQVTAHAVGDRAGVGCMVRSCGECVNCVAGREQYCVPGNTLTYGAVDEDGTITQGGYSTHIVVDERFVLSIPDGIGLDAAAPLLCAGITTYSPLRRHGAGPGKNVAVVGLGGLGHMTVKLAHALAARVTVLSQSLKKQEDGIRLGADAYFATSDTETFDALAGNFDLIVNTVSADLDMDVYLGLLAADGVMVNVGAPAKPLSLNAFSLLRNGRSISGSMIGGIAETQEMLDFCAAHGLGADIETISAEEINGAYERVLASDVRYRFVIESPP
jgi:uncharacterized zinc-type alcohol dehydrogenase-like protein